MSYLDVISLEDAKNHLRVDADFLEDDEAITRMIKSALGYVENFTCHMLYSRSKTYKRYEDDKKIVVFDHPITQIPTDEIPLHFSWKTEFVTDEVDLTVGYQTKNDIPSELIDAAYQIIDNWYYNHEKNGNMSIIPEGAEKVLFSYKRDIAI
ncbi:MAG: head-tail connector protein [Lactobacillus helveticus]